MGKEKGSNYEFIAEYAEGKFLLKPTYIILSTTELKPSAHCLDSIASFGM